MIVHDFKPIFQKKSRILILGSFPSVKSREESFYYGHPQNRFWKMMALIFGEKVPETIEEKTRLILEHELALYDACKKCEITGSSDHSLVCLEPSDLSEILLSCPIEKILCNGRKSYEIVSKERKEKVYAMPSTSPANARYRIDDLVKVWKEAILDV